MTSGNQNNIRRSQHNFQWDEVEDRPYKEDARALFRLVTRRILFSDPGMQGELRYFEVAPGGFTTLERHNHMHAVMVLRGDGHCLIGSQVQALGERDLVTVPPMTWHQFRATGSGPLGFLCMVDAHRDRPQVPTADELAQLRVNDRVRAFLDGAVNE